MQPSKPWREALAAGEGSVQYGREEYKGGTKDWTSLCNVWNKPLSEAKSDFTCSREATQRSTTPSQSDQRRGRWRKWKVGLTNNSFIPQCMAGVLPRQLLNLSTQSGFGYIVNQHFSMEEWFSKSFIWSKFIHSHGARFINLRCMQMIYFIIFPPYFFNHWKSY